VGHLKLDHNQDQNPQKRNSFLFFIKLGTFLSAVCGGVVLNGECSFLIPHLRMGCCKEAWVKGNTFKVDQARGTV
jgi:hypothetical protein